MAVLVRAHSQATAITQALHRAGVPLQAVVPADGLELRDEEPDDRTGTEVVTVCTFHRAKGLQWTSVWVCGLEAGFVPIAYASTPAALAEERRLLYVALSRAERELHCSWARHRRATNGAMLWREPSPWLAALAGRCALPGGAHQDGAQHLDAQHLDAQHLDAQHLGDRPYPTGETGRGRRGLRSGSRPGPDEATLDFIVSARRRLARSDALTGRERGPQPDPSTAAVAQRLTDWRRRTARSSGVPAHVLMHDSTVAAIALRKPASEEELCRVPGLGAVKVARFGPAILELVHENQG
jgi:DNA helicase II / ATP-dependent DNA helicase PcrA